LFGLFGLSGLFGFRFRGIDYSDKTAVPGDTADAWRNKSRLRAEVMFACANWRYVPSGLKN
jgi:hypothetical protein